MQKCVDKKLGLVCFYMKSGYWEGVATNYTIYKIEFQNRICIQKWSITVDARSTKRSSEAEQLRRVELGSLACQPLDGAACT